MATNRTPVPQDLQDNASEAQMKYILDLCAKKDLSKLAEEQLKWLEETSNLEGLTKSQASRIIGALVPLPTRAQPAKSAAGQVDVPAGRYAVRDSDVVKFYHVERPTEGRWAGYTFLSIRASDDLHPIKDKDVRQAILRQIAKDPHSASVLYGQELGSCGVCGRTLTNEQSRADGIGPICKARMGW